MLTTANLIWAISTVSNSIAQETLRNTYSICTLVLTDWTSDWFYCGFWSITRNKEMVETITVSWIEGNLHSYKKLMFSCMPSLQTSQLKGEIELYGDFCWTFEQWLKKKVTKEILTVLNTFKKKLAII